MLIPYTEISLSPLLFIQLYAYISSLHVPLGDFIESHLVRELSEGVQKLRYISYQAIETHPLPRLRC